MLVERGAVEAGEAVRIGRKVRRHPVEDHAEPGGVRAVDEAGEVLGRAETRGRREQAERLVAPRAAERMLGDRQQLEMGEAHVDGVGDQPVGQRRPSVLLGAHPRAEMDLVDRYRRVLRLALARGRPSTPASFQSKAASDEATTEAVAGGVSVCIASGSAFCGSGTPPRADDVELVARARVDAAARTVPRRRRESAAASDDAARPRR